MPRLNSPFMIATQHAGVSRPWWEILNKRHRDALGQIGWYPEWRRYVFVPMDMTVLSADCMQALAQFCEDALAETKAAV